MRHEEMDVYGRFSLRARTGLGRLFERLLRGVRKDGGYWSLVWPRVYIELSAILYIALHGPTDRYPEHLDKLATHMRQVSNREYKAARSRRQITVW